MKRTLSILVSGAMALAGLAVAAPAANAATVDCQDVTRGQTVDGDLVVSQSAFSCVLNDVTVKGDVVVEAKRGSFAAQGGSHITGNVTAVNEPVSVSIHDGSVVDGDVTVSNATAQATITLRSKVRGNVNFTGNRSLLQVRGSTVEGNLAVTDNRGSSLAFYNSTIEGNLIFSRNTGGLKGVAANSIRNNTIGGNLECEANVAAPQGRDNVVGGTASGQCATFVKVEKPKPVVKFKPAAPYTLPGNHVVNGRDWRTTCEPYSRTQRCRTEIQATVVKMEAGRFVRETGWAFNNLTYLPYMTEAAWKGNPLGDLGATTNGLFDSAGRQWRTECDTAATGRDACRSYTMTTVYAAAPKAAGGYTFSQKNEWVFNNIVMFGGPEKRP